MDPCLNQFNLTADVLLIELETELPLKIAAPQLLCSQLLLLYICRVKAETVGLLCWLRLPLPKSSGIHS